MSNLYKNKYHIPSARTQRWDYGQAAAYFVTICTKNNMHYFGDVVAGKVQLSPIVKIVETEWLKTPNIRPDMTTKTNQKTNLTHNPINWNIDCSNK